MTPRALHQFRAVTGTSCPDAVGARKELPSIFNVRRPNALLVQLDRGKLVGGRDDRERFTFSTPNGSKVTLNLLNAKGIWRVDFVTYSQKVICRERGGRPRNCTPDRTS
jgi:hypothetical protein